MSPYPRRKSKERLEVLRILTGEQAGHIVTIVTTVTTNPCGCPAGVDRLRSLDHRHERLVATAS